MKKSDLSSGQKGNKKNNFIQSGSKKKKKKIVNGIELFVDEIQLSNKNQICPKSNDFICGIKLVASKQQTLGNSSNSDILGQFPIKRIPQNSKKQENLSSQNRVWFSMEKANDYIQISIQENHSQNPIGFLSLSVEQFFEQFGQKENIETKKNEAFTSQAMSLFESPDDAFFDGDLCGDDQTSLPRIIVRFRPCCSNKDAANKHSVTPNKITKSQQKQKQISQSQEQEQEEYSRNDVLLPTQLQQQQYLGGAQSQPHQSIPHPSNLTLASLQSQKQFNQIEQLISNQQIQKREDNQYSNANQNQSIPSPKFEAFISSPNNSTLKEQELMQIAPSCKIQNEHEHYIDSVHNASKEVNLDFICPGDVRSTLQMLDQMLLHQNLERQEQQQQDITQQENQCALNSNQQKQQQKQQLPEQVQVVAMPICQKCIMNENAIEDRQIMQQNIENAMAQFYSDLQNKECKVLRNQVERCGEQYAQLLTRFQNNIFHFEQICIQHNEEATHLRQKIGQHEGEQKEKQYMESQCMELQNDILKEKQNSLQEKEKSAILKEQLQANQKSILMLEESIQSKNKQLQQAIYEKDKQEEKVSHLTLMIEQGQEKAKTYESQITAQQEQINIMHRENENLKMKCDSAAFALESLSMNSANAPEKETRIKQLQQAVLQHQLKEQEQQKLHETLQHALENAQFRWQTTLNSQTSEDLTQLKKQITGMTLKLSAQGVQLQEKGAQLVQVQYDHNALKMQSARLQNEQNLLISKLQKRLNKQNQTNKSLYEQKQLLEVANENLKQQVDELKEAQKGYILQLQRYDVFIETIKEGNKDKDKDKSTTKLQLNQYNNANQTNQTNSTNQINQISQINQTHSLVPSIQCINNNCDESSLPFSHYNFAQQQQYNELEKEFVTPMRAQPSYVQQQQQQQQQQQIKDSSYSSEVEAQLQQYMNNTKQNQLRFVRIGAGAYQFGNKKVFVNLKNDKLVIRTGGGYMMLQEFLDLYTQQECLNLNQNKQNDLQDQVEQIQNQNQIKSQNVQNANNYNSSKNNNNNNPSLTRKLEFTLNGKNEEEGNFYGYGNIHDNWNTKQKQQSTQIDQIGKSQNINVPHANQKRQLYQTTDQNIKIIDITPEKVKLSTQNQNYSKFHIQESKKTVPGGKLNNKTQQPNNNIKRPKQNIFGKNSQSGFQLAKESNASHVQRPLSENHGFNNICNQ